MISPLAYVHPSAKIGKDVEIQPFAYIEEGVEIGDGCLICSQTSILKGTKLGKNNRVYNGAILGAEPQDLHYEGKQGTLVIGDDCEIRENVLIARSLDETSITRIGSDCALMDGAHICHSSQIGDHCILGIHTIVGSKSRVDDYAILSNATVLHQGVRIGSWSFVQSGSVAQRDVPPFIVAGGNPAAYHGTNKTVLKNYAKGAFSEDDIRQIMTAYLITFQGITSLEDATERIKDQVDDIPARQQILDFFSQSEGIIRR